jgi:hypothetical protein
LRKGRSLRFTALRSKGIWKTSATFTSCCSRKITGSAHISQPLFFKAAVVCCT